MRKEIYKYIDYIFVVFIYGLLHIFMHNRLWDDAIFATYLNRFHFDLVELISDIYMTWSGRWFLWLVMVFLTWLPPIIWKIADLFFIFLAYYSIKKLTFERYDNKRSNIIVYVLLFCSFPFALMGTTGWISTTVVYVWTMAMGLYLINQMVEIYNGKKIKKYQYFIFAVMTLYTSNSEMWACILLIVQSILLILSLKKRAKLSLIIEGMSITLFNIALALMAPGNRIRLNEDAHYHDTYAFFELTFWGKLRMGINTTFYHFTAVPNVIFLLMCIIVAAVALYRYHLKKCGKTAFIALIPIVIDCIWTGYFFFFYTIPNRTLTYLYPDMLFETYGKTEQYMAVISCMILMASLVYSLYLISDDLKCFMQWLFILLLGAIPEIALGFTTTVSASILRVAAFLYFAMMIVILQIINRNDFLRKGYFRIAIYLVTGIGTVLNMAQVIRHIMVYG